MAVEIIRDPNEAAARRLAFARGLVWEEMPREWQTETRRQAKLAVTAATQAKTADGYHHTVAGAGDMTAEREQTL